jgi:hypothetical protein
MAPYPHMPATAQPSGTGVFACTYTATGSEGTDVTVSIGKTMFDATYAVVFSSAGGTSGTDSKQSSGVEVVDIPIASRTTTTFRIVLGQQPAVGDKLQFIIMGNLA